MIVLYRYFIVFAVTAVAMPAAPAQQQAGRPVSTDPEAIVPPTRYESAFGDYVPYSEPKIAPWRDINDEAARIGGHAGAMGQSGVPGETRESIPVTAPAAPSSTRPAMPGHGAGHK